MTEAAAVQAEHNNLHTDFGDRTVTLDRRHDGAILVTPVRALPPFAPTLINRLEHWAAERPDATFVAERSASGDWRKVSYAGTLAMVQSIASALITRPVSVDRPVAILSGNDIDHLMTGLAAMYIGVPYAPVSPGYSTFGGDFGKLHHIFNLITPGLVFVADAARYAKAIRAVWPAGTEVIATTGSLPDYPVTLLETLRHTPSSSAAQAARARISPDTIAKFLLTSGSTSGPKAVITTQRMLTSNQAMIRESMPFLKDGPTLLDWLPWNHTFGGSHNVGIALYNGGSLFLDDGKPVPGGFDATVRNLHDVRPTVYFNVPKGFETLVPHLREDSALRSKFFSQLKAMFYAGANLPAHVWEALDDLAQQTIGRHVPILSGLGATETAPYSLANSPATSGSGRIGLPVSGNVLKLVSVEGKLEACVRGPNVTPGYWRQPELTAKAFDEEGYYHFGDALRFVDEKDITLGFWFDGRLTEDFKLGSGTWVNAAAVRARFIAGVAPLARDIVLVGLNREELTGIVIVDPDECLKVAEHRHEASDLAAITRDPGVRKAFAHRLAELARLPGGSSTRVARIILLETPPSFEKGEITDKGSLNQKAIWANRAAEVDYLYASPAADHVIAAD